MLVALLLLRLLLLVPWDSGDCSCCCSASALLELRRLRLSRFATCALGVTSPHDSSFPPLPLPPAIVPFP